MKKVLTFITMLLSILCVNIPAKAEATNAQEMYQAVYQFSTALDNMNSILAGVNSKATADAAVEPFMAEFINFATQISIIRTMTPEGDMDSATEREITNLMANVERAKKTFERHCQRLADTNFYGSEALLDVFKVIAETAK